jgi:phytoene synthase
VAWPPPYRLGACDPAVRDARLLSADAAGDSVESVTAELGESYAWCRALHRSYGRSYYLATRMLPAWKRPHVHALYGFARYTDEIVDHTGAESAAERAVRLRGWTDRLLAALDGAPAADPILPALLHTIDMFDLDLADFTAFLRSMAMDLTVTEYPTYAALLSYMDGSAAAIGTLMLPSLGSPDRALAREPARQLGLAFQLTNFIRDVSEDLDRGRIYLPREDLARFGVTPADLRQKQATGPIRALIAFEIGRARWHYAHAAPGILMLDPSSQSCIRAAYLLYGGILTEVERAGHDVFRCRATVPVRRRLAILGRCLLTPAGEPMAAVPG